MVWLCSQIYKRICCFHSKKYGEKRDSKVPETKERELACMQSLFLPSQWKLLSDPRQERVKVQTMTNNFHESSIPKVLSLKRLVKGIVFGT